MKPIVLFASLLLLLTSCSEPVDEALYGNAWELEYITGPKIAFWALYPDRKPAFQFNAEKHLVDGQNSCNGYMAPVVIEGHTISFRGTGPYDHDLLRTRRSAVSYDHQKVNKVPHYQRWLPGADDGRHGDDALQERGQRQWFGRKRHDSARPEGWLLWIPQGWKLHYPRGKRCGGRPRVGHPNVRPFGKRQNTGIFSGTVRDGKLVGRYRFSSEGPTANDKWRSRFRTVPWLRVLAPWTNGHFL